MPFDSGYYYYAWGYRDATQGTLDGSFLTLKGLSKELYEKGYKEGRAGKPQIPWSTWQRTWYEELNKKSPVRLAVVRVTIPKSGDGTEGFGFQLEGCKVRNVVIDKIDTSGLPLLVRPLVPNKNKIKAEVENQLGGNDSYGFNSLAPNTDIDETRKQTYEKERIRILLRDQKVYPKPGSDWYIKITGEIELDINKAWIAPSKKK